jgi:hypothetical protein
MFVYVTEAHNVGMFVYVTEAHNVSKHTSKDPYMNRKHRY